MTNTNHEQDAVSPAVYVENKIYIIRGIKVMLDEDLAALYGVPTKRLNQAVKRNMSRFPPDFMFELTKQEDANWRSQIVTSNSKARRWSILAFTEQGIAMLSTVLRSDRAIQVNIQIMRAFTQMRRLLVSNEELRLMIEDLERRHEGNFQIIFEALKELMSKPEEPKEPRYHIGFDPS
jgi:hypothetical protein